MYKTILVPLDGSKRAESILPHVERLAMHYHATLIFLQVVEPPPLIVGPEGDITLHQQEMERGASHETPQTSPRSQPQQYKAFGPDP